jgi:hypothetical protein
VIVPDAQSRAAIAELEAGKGKRFSNAEALFDDSGVSGRLSIASLEFTGLNSHLVTIKTSDEEQL